MSFAARGGAHLLVAASRVSLWEEHPFGSPEVWYVLLIDKVRDPQLNGEIFAHDHAVLAKSDTS